MAECGMVVHVKWVVLSISDIVDVLKYTTISRVMGNRLNQAEVRGEWLDYLSL